MNVQLDPYSLKYPVLQGGDVERGERRSPCAGWPIIPSTGECEGVWNAAVAVPHRGHDGCCKVDAISNFLYVQHVFLGGGWRKQSELYALLLKRIGKATAVVEEERLSVSGARVEALPVLAVISLMSGSFRLAGEAPKISGQRYHKPLWAPWDLAKNVDSRAPETSFPGCPSPSGLFGVIIC